MKKAHLLLRVGIAFAFLYAAVNSFLYPDAWVGFFPLFVRKIIPGPLLLQGFSFFEIALALWLLWGKKAMYAALLSAAAIFGVVAANLGALDIVFRDITIFFAALALTFLSKSEK